MHCIYLKTVYELKWLTSHIDGLAQDCCDFVANNALQLLQSCSKPSISSGKHCCNCYPAILANWPNSQIPECTCLISHNVPFKTDMCSFLFWMEHYGMWNTCILGFVKLVYSLKCTWISGNTRVLVLQMSWPIVIFCRQSDELRQALLCGNCCFMFHSMTTMHFNCL